MILNGKVVDGRPVLRLRLTDDLIHDTYDNGADGRPIHSQYLRGRNALAENEDGFAGACADGVDGKQGVAAGVAIWMNRLNNHKFSGCVGRMFQCGNNAAEHAGQNHENRELEKNRRTASGFRR